MNSTTEQLFEAALSLPEADRVELVEALIVSLQSGDRPPFDESWREVIQRRASELRSGQVTLIPWAEYQMRGPQVAARFGAEMDRVLGLVANNPEMFPAYDDEHRFAWWVGSGRRT